jgi:hypothetical protein
LLLPLILSYVIIMIMTMITGVMNTGMMIIGVTAFGFVIHMDTTVYVLCGGIHGGGIIIGGGAIGADTFTGISFIVDTMLYGMNMVAGGTDLGMVAG